MQKRHIFFIGPDQLRLRILFLYGQDVLLRHIRAVSQLRAIVTAEESFSLIVKPQFESSARQAGKQFKKMQLYIDRFDDSTKIKFRNIIVGESEHFKEISSGQQYCPDLASLPKEIFLKENIFTKIYIPLQLQGQAAQIQKKAKSNLQIFTYSHPQLKNYIIGDVQKHSLPDNVTVLSSPQELQKVQDINKVCYMNIYCSKNIEKQVLKYLDAYKGHKQVFLCNDKQSILPMLHKQNRSFRTRVLQLKQKQLIVYISKNRNKQTQYKIKSLHPESQLKYLQSSSLLGTYPNTKLILYCHEDERLNIERKIQSFQDEVQVNVFMERNISVDQLSKIKRITSSCAHKVDPTQRKRAVEGSFTRVVERTGLFFVNDRELQKKELLTGRYPNYQYNQVKSLDELREKLKDLNGSNKILIVAHQSNASELRSIAQGDNFSSLFFGDQAQHVIYVTGQVDKHDQYKISSLYPYCQLRHVKSAAQVREDPFKKNIIFCHQRERESVQQKVNSFQSQFQVNVFTENDIKVQEVTMFKRNMITQINQTEPTLKRRSLEASFADPASLRSDLDYRRILLFLKQENLNMKAELKANYPQFQYRQVGSIAELKEREQIRNQLCIAMVVVNQSRKEQMEQVFSNISRDVQIYYYKDQNKMKNPVAQKKQIDSASPLLALKLRAVQSSFSMIAVEKPVSRIRWVQSSFQRVGVAQKAVLLRAVQAKFSYEKEVQQKFYIKEQNRKKHIRQKIILAGNSPKLSSIRDELSSKYQDQVLCQVLEKPLKLREYEASGHSIIIAEESLESQCVQFCKKNVNNQNVNLIMLCSSPQSHLSIYQQHKRLAMISHKTDPVIEQVSNYLKAPSQQKSIVQQQRRKAYPRFRLHVPAANQRAYFQAVKNSGKRIDLKPYQSLTQLDLMKPEKPILLVLNEEDKKHVNKLSKSQIHLFQVCRFPSDQVALLKNQKVSGVLLSHRETAEQIQHYLSQTKQTNLLRKPEDKFVNLLVACYNPNNNQQLNQLSKQLRNKHPYFKHTTVNNLLQVREAPAVVLTSDAAPRHVKQTTNFAKSSKQIYQVILTPSPSDYNQLFNYQKSITAVVLDKQSAVSHMLNFKKDEETIFIDTTDKANSYDVLLVDLSPQQSKCWEQIQQQGQLRPVSMSSEQFQSADLMSRPVIVVTNIQNKKKVLFRVKQNQRINPLQHIFFITSTPSAFIKLFQKENSVRLLSHQADVLPSFARKCLNEDPLDHRHLLRLQNRRQVKKARILWKDNNQLQSSKALRELSQKVGDYGTVQYLDKQDQQDNLMDKPLILVLPSGETGRGLNIISSKKQQPTFLFLHCENPIDRKKLFQQIPRISLISCSFQQIADQINKHYIKRTDKSDLIKPLERKVLSKPKVILMGFQDSPFQSQAQEIRQSLPSHVKVLQTCSQNKIKQSIVSDTIIIFHQQNKQKGFKIGKDLSYDSGLRLMLITDDPSEEEEKFFYVKRLVLVTRSLQNLIMEIKHYTGSQEKKTQDNQLTKIKSMLELKVQPQDFIIKRYPYLQKNSGKLVHNMQHHRRKIEERELVLASKSPSPRLQLKNPVRIYL